MQGAADRLKRDWKRDLSLAWYGAAFARAEKLPRLADLLREPGRKSFAEVAAHMRQITKNMPRRTWDEWRRHSSARSA